jgi:ABC-type arginine/histidine transport system permease subunit
MLKKSMRFAFIFIVSIWNLIQVLPAFAQFGLETTGRSAQYQDTNIFSVLSSVITMVLSFTGIIFLAVMFYAGLRWMTASGNEEFASKAKEAMFAAVIGLLLVTAAYGISTFVFSKIGN